MSDFRNEYKRILLYLAYLCLFFLGTALTVRPLVPGESVGFGYNFLIHVLVLCALLFWLLFALLRQELRIHLSGIELPAGIFLALVLVSPLVATSWYDAFARSLSWSVDLVVFFLVFQTARNPWIRAHLLRILVATCLVVSAYGLYQYFIGLDLTREAYEQGIPDRPPGTRDGAPKPAVDAGLEKEFLSRLGSDRIFSTFLLANALGGYLVLVIPVLLGYAADQLVRRGAGEHLAKLSAALALAVAAMALTLSRGSWMALAGGLAVFALLGARRRLTKGRVAVLVGVPALVVAAGLTGLVHVPGMSDLERSMRFRSGYWLGGTKVALDAPLTGVGLDNFGYHYFEHKPEWGDESKLAHNNFVQLAAELGLPGLVAFCWIWLALARMLLGPHGLRNLDSDAPPGPRKTGRTGGRHGRPDDAGEDPFAELSMAGRSGPTLFLLSGLFAFLLVFLTRSSFDMALEIEGAYAALVFLFFLLWSLTYVVHPPSGRPAAEEPRLAYVGMAAGIAGFLLHSLVDFDLYVAGIHQTAWALCGLLLARLVQPGRERTAPIARIPFAVLIVAVPAMVAAFYWVAYRALPRVMAAEHHLEQAKRSAKEPEINRNLYLAAKSNPWDLRPLRARFGRRMQEFDAQPASHTISAALDFGGRLLARTPRDPSVHRSMARVFLARASQSRKVLEKFPRGTEGRARWTAQVQENLGKAAGHLEEAVRLYPTHPPTRLFLAEVYAKEGKYDQARHQLERARALSRSTPLERLRVDRQRADDLERRLAATGKGRGS